MCRHGPARGRPATRRRVFEFYSSFEGVEGAGVDPGFESVLLSELFVRLPDRPVKEILIGSLYIGSSGAGAFQPVWCRPGRGCDHHDGCECIQEERTDIAKVFALPRQLEREECVKQRQFLDFDESRKIRVRYLLFFEESESNQRWNYSYVK